MRQVDACPSDPGMNPVTCFLLLELSYDAAGAELRRHIREGKKTSRKAEEGKESGGGGLREEEGFTNKQRKTREEGKREEEWGGCRA